MCYSIGISLEFDGISDKTDWYKMKSFQNSNFTTLIETKLKNLTSIVIMCIKLYDKRRQTEIQNKHENNNNFLRYIISPR